MVRDLHAAEVLAKRPPQPAVSKVFPFKVPERAAARAARQQARATTGAKRLPVPTSCPCTLPAAGAETAPTSRRRQAAMPAPSPAAGDQRHEDGPPAEPVAERPRSTSGLLEQLERMTVAPLPPREPRPQPRPVPAAAAEPRFHLTLDHDVVDGPTIGPKTAERLYPHGIKTVRDLIKAEPAALAVPARQPPHHAGDHRRLAGPGAARLHGAGAAGARTRSCWSGPAIARRRRSPRPTPTSCAPTCSPSPRPRTASACCATAIRPTSRRSRAGSRPPSASRRRDGRHHSPCARSERRPHVDPVESKRLGVAAQRMEEPATAAMRRNLKDGRSSNVPGPEAAP